MMRVCSDLLHAFFSFQRDYNKKRRNPFLARIGFLFPKYIPKEVSKCYDTYFKSILQAKKYKTFWSGMVWSGNRKIKSFRTSLSILWFQRANDISWQLPPLHDYFKSQSYRNRNTTDSKYKVRLLWTYSRSFARDADSVFLL